MVDYKLFVQTSSVVCEAEKCHFSLCLYSACVCVCVWRGAVCCAILIFVNWFVCLYICVQRLSSA